MCVYAEMYIYMCMNVGCIHKLYTHLFSQKYMPVVMHHLFLFRKQGQVNFCHGLSIFYVNVLLIYAKLDVFYIFLFVCNEFRSDIFLLLLSDTTGSLHK